MAELSPAAKAILEMVNAAPHCGSGRIKAAATLRAAAEELQYRLFLPGCDPMVVDAKALFDLANELEGK
jgi:hypothetical protein